MGPDLPNEGSWETMPKKLTFQLMRSSAAQSVTLAPRKGLDEGGERRGAGALSDQSTG